MPADLHMLHIIAFKFNMNIGRGVAGIPSLRQVFEDASVPEKNPQQLAKIVNAAKASANLQAAYNEMVKDFQEGTISFDEAEEAEMFVPLIILATNDFADSLSQPEAVYTDDQLRQLIGEDNCTQEVSDAFAANGADFLAQLCKPKI